MKPQRPDYSGIFAYFKNTLHQKALRKKAALVTMSLFVLLFVFSYLWKFPLKSTENQHKTALTKKNEYQCTLHRIIDGDTIVAHCPLDKPQRVNIRIWGMDAPETGQTPWGNKATNTLNNIFRMNKHDIITIRIKDIDQYNRYVGQIFINNKETDVGLEMVSKGYAVVYRQYNNDPEYLKQEALAKKAKKGIWQTKGSQQDPASWRKVNPF